MRRFTPLNDEELYWEALAAAWRYLKERSELWTQPLV